MVRPCSLRGMHVARTLEVLAITLTALALNGCGGDSSVPEPSSSPPSPASKTGKQVVDEAAAKLPQMLPDADPGIPAWAGQQADEPFDVRKYLESRVAPPDNAASLYFAALAEVSTDMYRYPPVPGWPWDADKVPPQVKAVAGSRVQEAGVEQLRAGAVPLVEIERFLADAQPDPCMKAGPVDRCPGPRRRTRSKRTRSTAHAHRLCRPAGHRRRALAFGRATHGLCAIPAESPCVQGVLAGRATVCRRRSGQRREQH